MSITTSRRLSFDLEKHSKEQHRGSIADVSSFPFLSLTGNYTPLTYSDLPQALVDDPNFDPAAVVPKNESPYPEVRCAVANTDDPTMPVSTLRAWVIGLLFAIVVPGTNQFFFFRYPAINIGQVCLPLFFMLFCIVESSRLCKT